MPISRLGHFFEHLLRPFRQLLHWGKPYVTHPLTSTPLARTVLVDVYLRQSSSPQAVFIFLDGQDLRGMPIKALQEQLRQEGFPSFMVVGIHANEARMWEYGTLSRADYGGRGNRAPQTAQFILTELLPFLRKRYPMGKSPDQCFVAGFSLGALVAFDLAWHHPEQFGAAGIFSGALWWRSRPYNKKAPDANRILHTQVSTATTLPPVRYWFQAGTQDEDSDRNNNGIIDAIDDTLQLMELLREKGQPAADLHYLEIPDGRHEPTTWAKALPDFLRWCLGPDSKTLR